MNCSKLIPTDSIEKVTCSLCSNYLSYFPVSLIGEDRNVCGRCSIPEGTVGFRNKAFEEIAQHVKFPCRFKKHGCYSELCPKDVPSHEKNCDFKIFECPGRDLTGCSWQGFYNNMLTHCRDSHQDEFLQNNVFELTLNGGRSESKKFLEYDGQLFVICMINDVPLSKTLSFMMYHVEAAIDLENYSYQVVFTRDEFTFTVKSVTTSFAGKKFQQVSLDCLLKNNIADTTPLVGNIAFEKNVIGKELNEILLSSLACSCSNYIQNYHTYQQKICKCKIEKSDMTKIVEILDYPCHYKNNGCNIVLKSEKMKKHLLRCPFKSESCQFCQWNGLHENLKNHIFGTHAEVVVGSSEIISVQCSSNTTQSRVIHCGNHLFKLQFNRESDYYNGRITLKWDVSRIISTLEDVFYYEVEIINTEKNLRLLLKKCVAADKKRGLCELRDICAYLFTENKLTFKINIYEN